MFASTENEVDPRPYEFQSAKRIEQKQRKGVFREENRA